MLKAAGTLYAKLVDGTRRPIDEALSKLSRTWLFGTLFRCQRETYFGAFYEFLHGLIFATMPFWLGALALTVLILPPTPTPINWDTWGGWLSRYLENAVATFSHGELLVFTISLLSPTLWLTTHEPKGAEKLPHRRPLSTIAIVVIIIGAVLFSSRHCDIPAGAEVVTKLQIPAETGMEDRGIRPVDRYA